MPNRVASYEIPYPARIEVLPLLKGSQANPTRGAKFLLSSREILSPKGDVCPLILMPLVYFWASCVASSQFAVNAGAAEALYKDGSKVVSSFFTSTGWR